MTIRCITVDSPLGPLSIGERDGKIVTLNWGVAKMDMPTPLLESAAQQLNAYFYCGLRKFELPLAPAGTVFRQRVWEEMVKIPYGQTRNYGEMARRLDSAARAIGGACGENPIPIIIPCHRVVASGPHIGGYSGRGGCDTKRALLELEGASHRP